MRVLPCSRTRLAKSAFKTTELIVSSSACRASDRFCPHLQRRRQGLWRPQRVALCALLSVIYVFYTLGTPNHDRLSRFTVNQALTSAASELVLYEDPDISGADHHGGAIMFGNDNMLYVTTGEQFVGPAAQDMANPAPSTSSRPTDRQTGPSVTSCT
jgi:glucose/arabinose dehydrogenase